MAEINNVIAEASQDLQTIEDFVNLPADSEVYPRLLPSVNVGTLAGARQAIFEAGGLPATPFKTKALMTASALVDGKYAMVTDDTVNNGLYVKTAGAWVKSAYDPLTQAKTYADTNKADTLLRVQNVFATKALMTASALVDGSNAQVNNDTTADNNGFYKKTAGNWAKSGYDPLTQAKSYTDTSKATAISTAALDATAKADAAKTQAVLESNDLDKQLLQKNMLKEFKGVSSDIIPMYSDYTANNVILGYKKSSNSIVGVGLVVDGNKTAKVNEVQAKQGLREHTNDSADILPIVSDVTGTRVVLGYNKTKGKLVGNFDSSSYNKQNMLDNYNMVMFAGQSLANGAQAKPSLSVNSKYATALTFDNSLFAKKDSVSFVPLVEVDYTDTGETPLSGFANYVLTRAQMNYGVDINSHNLLTTGAGWGGSPIEWHKKGERIYEQYVIPQIHNALNVAPNIALRAVCWLHGETSQTGESPKEHYYDIVKSIINDINTDVTQYTKQDRPARLITYQISYKARVWDGVPKAHLQLVKDDVADLASPTYRFACASDNIHLTNEGSKLAGCYFARTYTQRIFGNRKPDWVEPLYATLSGDTIRVKFKVPQLPLRFETTELPSVVDRGVAVHVNGVKAVISTLTIEQDTLVIKLSEIPTGGIRVKYGYDYGTYTYNNFLSNGAGNLVDSTDEKVNINNKEFTMFHCSPHFDLPITTLEI